MAPPHRLYQDRGALAAADAAVPEIVGLVTDPKTCPDERELYELARGTISSQRGAAIRDHIGDCSACRAVVAGLATGASHPPAPDADTPRYELQRLLGTGGMGEVFLAHDRVLDRPVALKLLHEDGATDSRSQERVAREARALASLSDPNVVAVYDRGVLDGRPFLAMEYVRGKTLRQWLATGEHGVDRVLDVLAQAGRGLVAAHAIGVVHRDFKPDNVLVGDDGRARVTDFGLARAAPDAESRDVARPGKQAPTVTDAAAAGTPAYTSPERLAGATADARSDQYAFCVTAYEAIHGRRPADEAALLPARGPQGTDPRIARIDAVLARGLSPRPEDRFASMQELLQRLETARGARPRAVSGRRWLVAGVLTLLLGATSILVFAFVRRAPADAAARAALHTPCGQAPGACPSPLVCLHKDGNFCGASGAPGVCGWPSDGCNTKSPSVCGCDGTSYANQCEAHLRGVSTAYRGACIECSAASPCPDVLAGTKREPAFCHVGATASVCWPRPGTCEDAVGPPVCGWDGRTYASACEARRAGFDVEHEGPCPKDARERRAPDVPPEPAPTMPPGGLAFGFPDEQGMDAGPLVKLAEWIEREKLPVFSLLVSRNGVLVYELYTQSLTRDEAHYLMGATQAVTATLVGAAIDRHLVGPPETSVADALPASVFPGDASRERFRPVTIRDVLGMSAVDAPTPPRDRSPASKTRLHAFLASHNRARFALAQPVVAAPGTSFESTDITPTIATAILEYAAGKPAVDLAAEWLFEPMGFEHYEWMGDDASGIDNGAYGLRLRPIDMQKLGVLYLRKGEWEGHPLLSRDWVARSFTPWIRSSRRLEQADYGWYWWTFDFGPFIPGPTRPAGSWVALVANGWKGQRIAVFPDQGVVVTMTAAIEEPLDEHDVFRRVVGEFVAPSVEGTGTEPPHVDPASRPELAAILERIRTEPLPLDAKLEPRMVPSVEPKGTHHAFRPD